MIEKTVVTRSLEDILGRAEFIRNKKTVGRKKDLADIEAIGEELISP
jgi:hypothetical protein